MNLNLFTRRKAVEIIGLDGPTSAGGATMNVYLYDDGSQQTVEYDWFGREIAKYEGEPRDIPDGVTMPPPPPRPAGAAPLPPGTVPNPTSRPTLERRTPPTPPPPQQQQSPPGRKGAS